MSNRQDLLNALLRQNLYLFVRKVFATIDASQTFLPNWHIEVVCDWLMLAAGEGVNRLIITLPPRYLKSICASVALPAWILGRDPTARIICVSYTDELALKHARDCRKVMESSWYKRSFPGTRLSKKRSAVSDFETTRGGGRFTTSVAGSLTGRGGGYIIIDDPIKPQDALSKAVRRSINQWYDNTLRSRLDNKKTGVIILVMQRVHLDDLVGHVREKEFWHEIKLPAMAEEDETFTIWNEKDVGRKKGEALHPERDTLEMLEETRNLKGSFNFQAQYQQSPVPEAGNLIKRHWFHFYDVVPVAVRQADRIVQSWDPAISVSDTADWSVCTTWAIRGDDYYLIDVYRKRCDFLLTGKVIDENGEPLYQSQADKNGRRYCYYISKHLMNGARQNKNGWRLPAETLEGTVLVPLLDIFGCQSRLMDLLCLDNPSTASLSKLKVGATNLVGILMEGKPKEKRHILQSIIHRIELAPTSIKLKLETRGLAQVLDLPFADDASPITIDVPVRLQRRGVETKMIIHSPNATTRNFDADLCRLIAQAHR